MLSSLQPIQQEVQERVLTEVQYLYMSTGTVFYRVGRTKAQDLSSRAAKESQEAESYGILD